MSRNSAAAYSVQDAAVALASACVAWSIVALYLFLFYPHLFDGGGVALIWYGRGLALVSLCALPVGLVAGIVMRRALPVRLRPANVPAWLWAEVTIAIAAVPVLMWVVFALLSTYAFDSAAVLGAVAAAALTMTALVPVAVLAWARFVGSTRRLLTFAGLSAAAVGIAALHPNPPPSGMAAVPPPEEAERPETRTPPFRPNVILLTMDALRADHLSPYGYPLPTSPSIEALAREATLFSRCYAGRPKTNPSFASLFTGLRPARHGLRLAPAFLDDRFTTLAETLAANGYDTSAVVENSVLAPVFNFTQGFRNYESVRGAPAAATDRVVKWLRGRPAEPFFLWRHILDPHAPYRPAPEDAAMFRPPADGSPRVRINQRGSSLGGARPLQGHTAGLPVADYVSRYDAEIRSADAQIGRILAALDQTGLRQRSIVVFTSDHGESLGEHDYFFEHGMLAYDGAARIPLLIAVPAAVAGGAPRPLVSRVVENVDLLPTILQLCGIRPSEPLDGVSLLPWMLAGDDEAAGEALFEAGECDHCGPGWLDALVEGRWKYIHRRTRWMQKPSTPRDLLLLFNALVEGGLESDELYDLDTDPAEEHNLITREPERARAMRARLETRLAALPAAPANALEAPLPEVKIDQATRDALEQLGYGGR